MLAFFLVYKDKLFTDFSARLKTTPFFYESDAQHSVKLR
jgi:hypothetical protein